MKNLYLLTTQGLGDYYVVASDPTEAQNALKQILDQQNYGTSVNRIIINIKWIAEEVDKSLIKNGLMLSYKRLLIVQ